MSAMRMPELVVVLTLAAVLAVWTVHEKAGELALGYEEGRLAAERVRLRAAGLELRYQRSQLASPASLEALARRHGLDLQEPGRIADPASSGEAPGPGPSHRGARPALVARDGGGDR